MSTTTTKKKNLFQGGTVIMACRDDKRCADAVRDVAVTTKQADKVKAMHLDLASFMSIRAFAAEFKDSESIILCYHLLLHYYEYLVRIWYVFGVVGVIYVKNVIQTNNK